MSITFKHTSDEGRDICEKGPLVTRSLLLLICNREHSLDRDAVMNCTTDYWSPELERLWCALTLNQWETILEDRLMMTQKAVNVKQLIDADARDAATLDAVMTEIVQEVVNIYRDFISLYDLRSRYIVRRRGEREFGEERSDTIRGAASGLLPRPLTQDELDHIDRVVRTFARAHNQLPTPDISPLSSEPCHAPVNFRKRRLQQDSSAQ